MQMRLPALLILAGALGACTRPSPEPQRPADEAPRPRPVAIPHHPAGDSVAGPVGQVVYVPVYTDIYFRDARRRFPLTVTLSVRNTDPQHPLTVTAVQLYGTNGEFLREHLRAPLRLPPLGTAEYILAEGEQAAGSGGNFLVEWTAAQRVTDPVVEAVMIGSAGSQGISFVSVGRPLVRR